MIKGHAPLLPAKRWVALVRHGSGLRALGNRALLLQPRRFVALVSLCIHVRVPLGRSFSGPHLELQQRMRGGEVHSSFW